MQLRIMAALFASAVFLGSKPAEASDSIAAVRCVQMGYMVVDPIYMGQTMSGFSQWACASRAGINVKGPPFPVLICDFIGRCQQVAWTY